MLWQIVLKCINFPAHWLNSLKYDLRYFCSKIKCSFINFVANPLANSLQILSCLSCMPCLVFFLTLTLASKDELICIMGITTHPNLKDFYCLQFPFGLALHFIFVCHLLFRWFCMSKISTTNKLHFYYSILHTTAFVLAF